MQSTVSKSLLYCLVFIVHLVLFVIFIPLLLHPLWVLPTCCHLFMLLYRLLLSFQSLLILYLHFHILDFFLIVFNMLLLHYLSANFLIYFLFLIYNLLLLHLLGFIILVLLDRSIPHHFLVHAIDGLGVQNSILKIEIFELFPKIEILEPQANSFLLIVKQYLNIIVLIQVFIFQNTVVIFVFNLDLPVFVKPSNNKAVMVEIQCPTVNKHIVLLALLQGSSLLSLFIRDL